MTSRSRCVRDLSHRLGLSALHAAVAPCDLHHCLLNRFEELLGPTGLRALHAPAFVASTDSGTPRRPVVNTIGIPRAYPCEFPLEVEAQGLARTVSDRACRVSRVTYARHGQDELESGSRANIAQGPYPSPVSFDDRAADRKPHAHAARLGGVESVEQTVKTLYG
jgi:hypothetical protein